jgi:hypothetical protein
LGDWCRCGKGTPWSWDMVPKSLRLRRNRGQMRKIENVKNITITTSFNTKPKTEHEQAVVPTGCVVDWNTLYTKIMRRVRKTRWPPSARIFDTWVVIGMWQPLTVKAAAVVVVVVVVGEEPRRRWEKWGDG